MFLTSSGNRLENFSPSETSLSQHFHILSDKIFEKTSQLTIHFVQFITCWTENERKCFSAGRRAVKVLLSAIRFCCFFLRTFTNSSPPKSSGGEQQLWFFGNRFGDVVWLIFWLNYHIKALLQILKLLILAGNNVKSKFPKCFRLSMSKNYTKNWFFRSKMRISVSNREKLSFRSYIFI